ncbi:Uncharacterised protein [Mycobacteroides abscessus subsp. abscessus]|nr:Uncharacterised protein [Mycobacteroides abscessus subsp. abscessus]
MPSTAPPDVVSSPRVIRSAISVHWRSMACTSPRVALGMTSKAQKCIRSCAGVTIPA